MVLVRHLPHPTGDLLFSSCVGAAHGGMPVVAPWFATTLGTQMHGWAESLPWHDGVLSHEGLRLTFTVEDLTFRLSCRNESDTVRRVQLALHPYWAVDTESAAVRGVDGAQYFDKADGQLKRFRGDVTFGQEVDYVFATTSELLLADACRTLTLTPTGTDHAVVWNPGPVECANAPGLGDEEWRQFVCVEPALLGPERDGVDLRPGQNVEIGLRVQV
ncbi:hypothetical protein [Corynebacterium sp. HMSC29G08]|uniref:aldose epimerase family protein n=1 Tax=Corynebacterium sp. HMSC29G08 TaxID=1581069 RepID=UPI0008A36D48|nr:hypothetical protein [Corynebacterium sp. HMSC29G08]OFT85084.1 hypothetical protein HMPREF3101_03540 [Corynebacterium sp. HMSC29G08]